MQIGATGDFCSDVSAKMPVNVCTIVLWLWQGEVFHNFQALWVEIITQIKHRLKNNLLSFSREIGFLLQQLNASLLNCFIHSFIQHLIWALSVQQAWCLHVLADCICTDCFPVTTHLIPSRQGQNVNMAASYRWSLRMKDFRNITTSIISMKSHDIKSCLPATWFEERDLFIVYQISWSSWTIHLFTKKFQKNLSHFEFLHIHRGRSHQTLYLLCKSLSIMHSFSRA